LVVVLVLAAADQGDRRRRLGFLMGSLVLMWLLTAAEDLNAAAGEDCFLVVWVVWKLGDRRRF
jgi:hypothetical protein